MNIRYRVTLSEAEHAQLQALLSGGPLLRTGSQTGADFAGSGRGRDGGADRQDGVHQRGDDLPRQAQLR